MKFSLIVSTRNRAQTLPRLLDSLIRQTFQDFEVIVVDQSDEPHRRRVKDTLEHYPLRIAYIPDHGTGLSRARNLGIQHAKGEILTFPDDDAWYELDFLARVAEFWARHPHIDVLLGSYGEPGRRVRRFRSPAGRITLSNVIGKITEIALFIRASSLRNLRFCEKLGAGTSLPSGEGLDLLVRLLRQGAKLWYDPEYQVYHPIERLSTLDPVHRECRERASAFVRAFHAVYTRHPVWIVRALGGYSRAWIEGHLLPKDILRSRFARARLEGFQQGFQTARRDPAWCQPDSPTF